jgi:hypothetical protein
MAHLSVSAFVAVAVLLTCADPLLLTWLWVRRFESRNSESEIARFRNTSLWAALSASTVAIGLFWISITTAPKFNDPQHDAHFAHFVPFSFAAAVLALVLALVGKGRERWWIALSAVTVPFSWGLYAAMQ